jgi:hypothetical protein
VQWALAAQPEVRLPWEEQELEPQARAAEPDAQAVRPREPEAQRAPVEQELPDAAAPGAVRPGAAARQARPASLPAEQEAREAREDAAERPADSSAG